MRVLRTFACLAPETNPKTCVMSRCHNDDPYHGQNGKRYHETSIVVTPYVTQLVIRYGVVVAHRTQNKNIPRPRDATSVAISIGERPALNSLKTQSRSRLQKWISYVNGNAEYDSLFLISMNSKSRPPVLTKVLGNIVCDSLGADEDEHLSIFLAYLVKMLNELRPLLKVTADLDDLCNAMVGGKLHRSNVHLDEVLKEVLYAT